MIVGVGADVVVIARIKEALTRYGARFVQRVFTNGERQTCQLRADPAPSFAARFAAKEATIKVLGAPAGLHWQDLEVVGGAGQPPTMVLQGRAGEIARQRAIRQFHLSMSHDGPVALAFVIAET